LDFGLVKHIGEGAEELTSMGVIAGSPKYMAPEQIRSEKVVPATDVYALGVVLFEMLTGKAPFLGATTIDTLRAHLVSPPPAMADVAPQANVPEPLARVVYT